MGTPNSIDDWLDDAAVRIARKCGLDHGRIQMNTDYTCAWSVEYKGTLTLAQIIRVAQFMRAEAKSGPASVMYAAIQDSTGRIDDAAVRGLAEVSRCTDGYQPPPLNRYEHLDNVEFEDPDVRT